MLRLEWQGDVFDAFANNDADTAAHGTGIRCCLCKTVSLIPWELQMHHLKLLALCTHLPQLFGMASSICLYVLALIL